jgi:hypothetical protein
MAADKREDQDELDSLAFELFSKRAVHGRRSGEREALDAYKQAECFLATKKKLRNGELKKDTAQVMSECSAPNLPRNHPLNLVAGVYTDRRSGKQFPGDLGKVKRIHAWLQQHMTPDVNPEELVAALATDFQDLNWDLPTINIARAVFPTYASN